MWLPIQTNMQISRNFPNVATSWRLIVSWILDGSQSILQAKLLAWSSFKSHCSTVEFESLAVESIGSRAKGTKQSLKVSLLDEFWLRLFRLQLWTIFLITEFYFLKITLSKILLNLFRSSGFYLVTWRRFYAFNISNKISRNNAKNLIFWNGILFSKVISVDFFWICFSVIVSFKWFFFRPCF